MSPTMSAPAIILFAPEGAALPASVDAWLATQPSPRKAVRTGDELMAIALRSRPRLVVFDARSGSEDTFSACRRLKKDSYTGIVPAFVIAGSGTENVTAGFDARADEVVNDSHAADEITRRVSLLLSRSDRDLGVHPSTRLPGAGAIEREIATRLGRPHLFAVCYADLDHFKEYNDRYS